MFRQMLLNGASRATFAPENDQGAGPDDIEDLDIGADDLDDEDEDQEEIDEAEVEEDEEETEGEVVPAVRPPSRADNRVREATRIAAEAKAKAELLERELGELRNRQNQQPVETQAQFNERLNAMEPWDRTEYLRQLDAQRTSQTLAQMQFQQADSLDRTAYEALAARNPVAAKLRDEVEKRLAEIRRGGTTAPRETVLRWVIGDRALANAGRATGKAQRTATANIDRQTARAPNARADSQASGNRGSNTTAARDKRVAGYQL